MPRFVRQPDYTMSQLASIRNAHEGDLAREHGECRCAGKGHKPGAICAGCGKYRRDKWNRKKIRRWLLRSNIEPKSPGERIAASVSYEQLDDLRRSMQRIDAETDAERLSA